MTAATTSVPYGTAEPRPGNTCFLRYELRLPHPLDHVWAAVATPAGLSQWLALPDPWEPKLGAPTTLHWQYEGSPFTEDGRITAWDPGRVAEYTTSVNGRARFHLEPNGPDATILRFTNELRDLPPADLPARLAGWHVHFEFLTRALAGTPYDWSAWSLTRFHELLAEYETR
ncbi:SRPBCC domain-containing protein [Streptomyces sp. NPDC087440]|uniref:SRPBCC domain-containing protein n=1 Tax=Streptomyces sp. NPDC087440 TaxID=3365790 RepID=UPI0038128D89